MLRRLAHTSLLVGGAIVMTAAPAFAGDEVVVSRDGVTWLSALHGELFDPSLLWNPGMSRSTSVYVRNRSNDPGVLTVVADGAGTGSLVHSGDLHLAARLDGGRWFAVGAADDPRTARRLLPPGTDGRLDVRVSFDRRSTNQTQRDQVRLRFTVAARQDLSHRARIADHLPSAGGPALIGLAALAAGLVGSGLRLTRRDGRDV